MKRKNINIKVNPKLKKRFKEVIEKNKTSGKKIYSPFLEEALKNYIKEIEQETKNNQESCGDRDLSVTEKRKKRIVRNLEEYDKISKSLLKSEIKEVAGFSRPTVEKYEELVWGDLCSNGFEVSDRNSDLLVRKG